MQLLLKYSLIALVMLSCVYRSFAQTKKELEQKRKKNQKEIEYTNNAAYGGIEMKTYFPVGAKIEIKKINSQFSGIVEEITLHASDRLEHFITIQHDGMGHLIWATMGNIFMVNPCQLR